MLGDISFDQNGYLVNKVISVFQVMRNPEYHDDDVVHQYRFIAVAPTT
jgi:hypothetical protein